MADLDDFFAKKDKKKSTKAKPKFVTAEELVKNLEDTSKREAALKPKKEAVCPIPPLAAPAGSEVSSEEANKAKPVVAASAAAATAAGAPAAVVVEQPQPVAEEEWKEFEEEQRKDYSGLKIGQLTMNDEDDNCPSDGDEEDVDSDGNMVVETSGKRGGPAVWKKVIPAEEVTQIPMEKSTSKVYISPALRHSQGIVPRLKVRNRAAPDITNADYFPTLGAARPEEQRKKKNEPAFEEVRHGSRLQRVQEQSAAPVSVTNRFQTLDEDDS